MTRFRANHWPRTSCRANFFEAGIGRHLPPSMGTYRLSRASSIAVGFVLVCGLGFAAAYWGRPQASGAAPVRPAPAAVPVTTASATRSDVPVYATGLGTVPASLTVAGHSP